MGAAVAHRPDDSELLSRHASGDRDAFAELVSRYRGPVYGYLVRCGVPAPTRDDLAQEVFLRVHRGAPRFQRQRPVRVWLFTIVANTTRSYFRRSRPEVAWTVEQKSNEAGPLELVEARELEAFLASAMVQLPLVQREVIALTCTGAMQDRDAAAVLDLPVATVKTHRRRARLALARALARRRQTARRETFTAS